MNDTSPTQRNLTTIRWLTFFMFMMFAMTTDSVGVIIPQVIKEFRLSMTAAGAFHYATMSGIALAGIFLGYLADRSVERRPSFWASFCLPQVRTCSRWEGPFLSFSFSSYLPESQSVSSKPVPWH